MNIVFIDRKTLSNEVSLKPLHFTHHWQDYGHTRPEQVVDRALDATILINNKVPLGADILKQLPKLKLIVIPATGYNHIDLHACSQLGITVCNIPNYAETTVPEHVLALILALQRQIMPYHRSVAAGRWQESGQFCYFDYPIRDLKGSTLGIVGSGALGSAVAKLAACLGVNVIFSGRKNDPTTREGQVPFKQMLAQSDIISLHCPLTANTKHLLSHAEFAQMKRSPLIINTARGGLIDSAALVAALDSRQIRGAGIDVCSSEPPPKNHPFMQILDRDNFILTPHVAWSSIEAMQYLADQLIETVTAFVAGRAMNTVER